MGPSRSRREARSRQITGLARWNAKDGSDLHSRTDAHAFTTHTIAGIRPERREIGRRRRAPVGMASVASQRPIARVAVCGSAKFRLLTCDRRHQHTISAKTSAVFWPHERLAPRNPPGDQIGRARGRRRANEGKGRENDAYGPRSRGLQFLRGDSGRTGRASYLRNAGAGRGRRGKATRPRLRGESQDVSLSQATRGVRAGIGRAGPRAPAFREGRHGTIREMKKRGIA